MAVWLGRPPEEVLNQVGTDALIYGVIYEQATKLKTKELEAFGKIVADKVAELFVRMYS